MVSTHDRQTASHPGTRPAGVVNRKFQDSIASRRSPRFTRSFTNEVFGKNAVAPLHGAQGSRRRPCQDSSMP